MKKFLPIIIAVLMIGGYFGYTKFMGGGGGAKETPAQAQVKKKAKLAADKKARLKAPIDGSEASAGDTFTVTLADPTAHFAKFDVVLKVDSKTPFEAAGGEAKTTPPLLELPQIRDLIIHLVSAHTYADLVDPAKREALKDEIRTAIDKETEQTVVLDVYFTNFAVPFEGFAA